MNNVEKLKKLKNYYCELKHPYWTIEQWHKKIDNIFIEKNSTLRKFSVEEAIIRNLEFCYNAPEKRIRNKLESYEKEMWDLIRKRTKERLEWYNSL